MGYGLKLLRRAYFFLPGIALWFAGLPGGVLALAFSAFASQLLYGWGAHAALEVSDHPLATLGQRLPAQLAVIVGYTGLALLLVGGPLLLRGGLEEHVFWALFGLGSTALLLLAIRAWPGLGILWALDDDRLGARPVATLARARREARKLAAGNLEQVLEGLPPTAVLVAATLLPWVLPLFGVETSSDGFLYPWAALGLLLSPWAHGRLVAGPLTLAPSRAGAVAETRILRESAPEPHVPVDLGEVVAAAGSGSLPRLRQLAGSGARFDRAIDGRTPLIAAARAPEAARLDVVAWLLERGVDVDGTNARGRTALHEAAAADDVAVLRLLRGRGASLEARDREEMTPLAVACEAAAWSAVEVLLAEGADPHGDEGVVPLHLAAMARGDDPRGVQLLTDAGVSVDTPGKLGRTALMGAAMRGNALVADALLELGAEIDARDDFGNTALMEAARAGANAVLARFVLWNPQTEHRDRPGRTALLVAVSSRRADADTVRLLLAMGADREVANREGRRAADLAAAAGRRRMAHALGAVVAERGPEADTPVPLPDRDGDGPRVIDLRVFETAEDVAWAERQLRARSRTELDAAATLVPALADAAGEDPTEGGGGEAPEAPQLAEALPGGDGSDAPEAVDAAGRPAAAGHGPGEAVPGEAPEAASDTRDGNETPGALDAVVDIDDRCEETPATPEPLSLPPEAPLEHPAGTPTTGDGDAGASRAGLETLLAAALRDDIEDMQMVMEHEEAIPERWLVRAFGESVRAGRGIAPRWLVVNGVDPDARTEAGHTLLSFASRLAPPNIEVIEMLLEQGAGDADDAAIVLRLCRARQAVDAPAHDEARLPGVLAALVQRGAPLDAVDPEGRTALHWAARRHGRDAVERLLELGAAVDAVDREGNSPLMGAVVAGRKAVARVLLRHGADSRRTNRKGDSPLSVAMGEGDQTLIRMLMGATGSRASPLAVEDRGAAWIRAAAEGNLGRIKRLLGAGVALDAQDAQGCTALLRAAGGGHLPVVDVLLGAGADPAVASSNGTTPLGAAVLGHHQSVVTLLCDRGVPADQRQQHGLTPLMLAAARWYPRIVSMLLRAEADPNARDRTDSTALMAAVQNVPAGTDTDTGIATVKFLLKAGADVNAVNDEGQSALLLLLGVRARDDGSPGAEPAVLRFTEALIAAGAELDRQDVSGWSALHAAAAHGYRDAAALLLDAGASRRLRDINGLSPVDLAMERSFEDLVDLFIQTS